MRVQVDIFEAPSVRFRHERLALGGVKIYELVWFYRKNSNDLRGSPSLVTHKQADTFQEEKKAQVKLKKLKDA